MKVQANYSCLSFRRKLNTSEENEYAETLKKARNMLGGGNTNTTLIIPSASLPQAGINNTGVGSITSEDGLKFVDFAKKYWGINEVQLLPVGQYHKWDGEYPCYSGTSMDLGNHLIDIKSILSKEEFDKVVNSNGGIKDKVNFSNVVDNGSSQEKALKNLYNSMTDGMKKEFELYKAENAQRLETKGLFRALSEINGTADFKNWSDRDKNLFDEDIVTIAQREQRIKELQAEKAETIDFYKFQQFLAEKSLNKSKSDLNSKGVKLIADVPCNMSIDEVWSHPKAFLKDSTIGWGMPALDLESKEAEEMIREKFAFWAKRFDGLRVDAAHTYISPVVENYVTHTTTHKDYKDKFLKVIEDEVKKVKGSDFDLKNIRYEFACDPGTFNIYEGHSLKPYVKDRVKIYTSDYLSGDWGSVDSFVNQRSWEKDSFAFGVATHDSAAIKVSDTQVDALSSILKIPKEKLKNHSEFIKAKFAEPMSAKNMMLFFMNALGMDGQYKDLPDKKLNYTAKTPEEYEDFYIKSVKDGKGFNPMDALEKQFKAQGLDKTEPELYKKIQKFRDILDDKDIPGNKNTTENIKKIPYAKIGILILTVYLATYGLCAIISSKRNNKSDK